MPTNAIDWSKTLIYKIISKDPNSDFIYVGSTTDFTRRMRLHKHSCTSEKSKNYNIKLYQFIREHEGWNNFIMVLIEKFETCKDRLEAHQREQYWIDELNAKLNERRAYISREQKLKEQEQYRIDNYEHIQKRQREYEIIHKEMRLKYREQHKDEIRETSKQWRLNNLEQCRLKSKIYGSEHKEIIKERKANYRQANKDLFQERYKKLINTPYTCICGWNGNMETKNKHIKTSKIHQNWSNNQLHLGLIDSS